jgi:hypothetical protein
MYPMPIVLAAFLGAGLAGLAAIVDKSPARGLVTACVTGGMSLISFGFIVQMTWFPTLHDRLQLHGCDAEATIVRATTWNHADQILVIPLGSVQPGTWVSAVTVVDARYATSSGEVTAGMDVTHNLTVSWAQSEGNDIAGTKIDVVYDCDAPRKVLPKEEVGSASFVSVKQLGEGAACSAFIALTGLAVYIWRRREYA